MPKRTSIKSFRSRKILSFVGAASVPLSALPAWQGLFDHGNLRRGQRLLVARAAGGTGVFAVQFALHIGAEELSAITELIESGKDVPFVGKTFGLENV